MKKVCRFQKLLYFYINKLKQKKMALTASQIEIIANKKGLNTATVIPSQFQEIEYKTVTLRPFVTAYFLMNNETFTYTYSHTYNALNDKTTKRKPQGF